MAKVYERQEIVTYEYIKVEKETPIEKELKEELRKYRYELGDIIYVLDKNKNIKTNIDLFLSMTSHREEVPSGVYFVLATGHILYTEHHDYGYNWEWIPAESGYKPVIDYDHNLYR